MDTKIDSFWTSFGTILESILEPVLEPILDPILEPISELILVARRQSPAINGGATRGPIATGSELIRAKRYRKPIGLLSTGILSTGHMGLLSTGILGNY